MSSRLQTPVRPQHDRSNAVQPAPDDERTFAGAAPCGINVAVPGALLIRTTGP